MKRTQKLVELSTSGEGRPLASAWNCPDVFDMRRPDVPVRPAVDVTIAEPFPNRPSQARSEPDSKPSENTGVV